MIKVSFAPLPLNPATEALIPERVPFNYSEARKRDQDMFESWKKTGSKRDLGNLVESLSPVIKSEVNRLSGSLPPAALSAEAKKWTIKAIQTYDPARGTTISTHVMNYLPKVRRMNYKFQNAVRLPENMQLKFHEYNHGLAQLTEQLNREPSDDELAKHLGWSKGHTIKFKNSLYSDLIESNTERPNEFTSFNENAILMAHLMDQLSSEEKYILNHAKGMTATQLADKLGVNINRLNYLKSKLVEKIKGIKTDIKMY
jgi:DNA-directed RNA polymerase specialized sigma subunit